MAEEPNTLKITPEESRVLLKAAQTLEEAVRLAWEEPMERIALQLSSVGQISVTVAPPAAAASSSAMVSYPKLSSTADLGDLAGLRPEKHNPTSIGAPVGIEAALLTRGELRAQLKAASVSVKQLASEAGFNDKSKVTHWYRLGKRKVHADGKDVDLKIRAAADRLLKRAVSPL